jgi:hypothetical protein
MGKKAKAPPAPDYSPITSAMQAQAGKSNAYGDQQMGWAQDQFTANKATSDQVSGADRGVQDQANKFAGDLRDQYQGTYQPLQNKFAQQAQDYASPGEIDNQMGRAQADTAQRMDQARQNAQQNLESYGISPASTRFAALDIGAQAQKGAAVAAAGNQARTNTVNTGLALENQAIGHGLVMPSMVAGMQNTGLQAGAGAVNSGLATTASGANTMGTTPQYMNLSNGAYGLWGNTLNQGYNNQLSSFKANQSSSSGLGSALGAAAGMAANFVVPGSGMLVGPAVSGATSAAAGDPMGFAKGGAVPDAGEENEEIAPYVGHHFYAIPGHDESGHRMPVHEAMARFFHTGDHIGMFASPEHAHAHIQRQDYSNSGATSKYADGGAVDATEGGGVPADVSPSHGAVTDDVSAKLNSGEFVIPKDVAAWKGQEFFQKLIMQSRTARTTAPAKPSMGPPGQQGKQQQSPAPQGAVAA